MYIFALQFKIMKKVTQSLLIVLLFSFNVLHAHEGMWIPSLLKVLEGKIKIDDEIKQNNKIFGKVLIDQVYPFGLIKFKDSDIKISENFICGSAKIKLLKPNWFE